VPLDSGHSGVLGITADGVEATAADMDAVTDAASGKVHNLDSRVRHLTGRRPRPETRP